MFVCIGGECLENFEIGGFVASFIAVGGTIFAIRWVVRVLRNG